MSKLLLIACLLFIRSTSAGVIIFSDMGPEDTFLCCTGWSIGETGSIPPTMYVQGDQFTPRQSAVITDIYVGFTNIFGNQPVTFTLRSDTAGRPDGILSAFAVSAKDVPPVGLSSTNPIHFSAPGQIALHAGVPYWLLAESPSLYSWNWNSQGLIGPHYCAGQCSDELAGVNNFREGAFRVVGTPTVPEPTTLALLGAAVAGLAAVSRRKIAYYAQTM